MHPLVLRVINSNGHLNKVPISAIAFIGQGGKCDLPTFEEERFLKCVACKHHDFRDGIAINHYECDGCGTGYQVWNA